MSEPAKTVTACIVVIGNEILSGRTRDSNIQYLATELGLLGVQVRECRVIPDIEATVVATVNEVRKKFDYVFTTGGIGPTHDDITADCIAKAFGVGISEHPEAVARMTRHYGDVGAVHARRGGGWRGCRMAAPWSTIRCRWRPASRWKTSSPSPASPRSPRRCSSR